jgi:flagellar motor switch protein FliM
MTHARKTEHGSRITGPLLSNSDTALDRFPALQSVFEQIAHAISRHFIDNGSKSANISIKKIDADKIDSLQASLSGYAAGALCQMTGLQSASTICVSHDFVVALVELMFGAPSIEPVSRQRRGLTNIDRQVASLAIEHIASAIRNAFHPIIETDCLVGRIEDAPNVNALGRKNNMAFYCVFAMDALDRDIRAIVVLSRAALEPHRAQLSASRFGDPKVSDSRWTQKIHGHAEKTPVILSAVIEKPNMTLAEVGALCVGSLIELPIGPSSRMKLNCEGRTLYWCVLGQRDGLYTVRISDVADETPEVDTTTAKA